MTREYVGVSESDPVDNTAALMLEEGIDGAVVLRGSEPVGLLTDRDVLALVAGDHDPADTAVSDAMSAVVPSVEAGQPLAEAVELMVARDVRQLLVTNGDEIVGVLTEQDVVTAASSLFSVPGVEPTGAIATPAEADDIGMVAEPEADAESEYSTQSVCEVCGSLTRDLRDFNGQLICEDCRDV